MKNNTATPALALLVLDVALGMACVVLPFSFLFGLAGWSSDMSSLSSVHDGLLPQATSHPLYAVMAAAALGVGGVCSVLACNTPQGARVERAAAPILTGLAMIMVGFDPGLIVLPAFILQILCFWYPTLSFSSRGQ